ncbi:MAG: hypothetical protein ACMUIG_04330 [Thermoplasmatota archaeon]
MNRKRTETPAQGHNASGLQVADLMADCREIGSGGDEINDVGGGAENEGY